MTCILYIMCKNLPLMFSVVYVCLNEGEHTLIRSISILFWLVKSFYSTKSLFSTDPFHKPILFFLLGGWADKAPSTVLFFPLFCSFLSQPLLETTKGRMGRKAPPSPRLPYCDFFSSCQSPTKKAAHCSLSCHWLGVL